MQTVSTEGMSVLHTSDCEISPHFIWKERLRGSIWPPILLWFGQKREFIKTPCPVIHSETPVALQHLLVANKIFMVSRVSRPFIAFFLYWIHLWCVWFRGAVALVQRNSLPFQENMPLHETALYQTPAPASQSFPRAEKNMRNLYITDSWICISNSQSLAL